MSRLPCQNAQLRLQKLPCLAMPAAPSRTTKSACPPFPKGGGAGATRFADVTNHLGKQSGPQMAGISEVPAFLPQETLPLFGCDKDRPPSSFAVVVSHCCSVCLCCAQDLSLPLSELLLLPLLLLQLLLTLLSEDKTVLAETPNKKAVAVVHAAPLPSAALAAVLADTLAAALDAFASGLAAAADAAAPLRSWLRRLLNQDPLPLIQWQIGSR
mmetsp:Transcript_97425/g.193000  ORF Transcript_97425/g.193000 Transcript_97425/m.193000 type:complete len:213 (-) Transcript_97425:917-1555(-)